MERRLGFSKIRKAWRIKSVGTLHTEERERDEACAEDKRKKRSRRDRLRERRVLSRVMRLAGVGE